MKRRRIEIAFDVVGPIVAVAMLVEAFREDSVTMGATAGALFVLTLLSLIRTGFGVRP